MKRTIFAVIFLAAALMLNGCSAKPAVTAPETQTPVTERTTNRILHKKVEYFKAYG
ncbi:MAG: hypothetical protein ACI4KO_09215 [Ruminiclostridium sp.]